MALRLAQKIILMLFSVRPSLRPWLFFAILYFVPAALFPILKAGFLATLPQLNDLYKEILIHPGCLFGMAIFDFSTCIVAILFLAAKKSLNDGTIIKPLFKLLALGAILPLLFPLFEYILPSLFGAKVLDATAFANLFSDRHMFALFMIWIISVAVLGPIQEEIIFRGILQGYFKELNGGTAAVFLTTGAFAMVHIASAIFVKFNPLYLIFITFMSLLLCAVRERTNNLSFCISFHVVNNLLWIIFTVLYAASKMPIELT